MTPIMSASEHRGISRQESVHAKNTIYHRLAAFRLSLQVFSWTFIGILKGRGSYNLSFLVRLKYLTERPREQITKCGKDSLEALARHSFFVLCHFLEVQIIIFSNIAIKCAPIESCLAVILRDSDDTTTAVRRVFRSRDVIQSTRSLR